jgi:hypothetical protein
VKPLLLLFVLLAGGCSGGVERLHPLAVEMRAVWHEYRLITVAAEEADAASVASVAAALDRCHDALVRGTGGTP